MISDPLLRDEHASLETEDDFISGGRRQNDFIDCVQKAVHSKS